MLNEDGDLEVIKKYKDGGSTKVYIKAKHPTNPNCADLLLKKNADLKKIIRERGIICDNQTINTVMRKAIWQDMQNDLEFDLVEIDLTKEDAKKIWDKLGCIIPVYSLFQSDRKNSDDDSEVQDPLKEAVKQIFKDEGIQATLDSVAEQVRNKLQEVATRTLEKLGEMDDTIASSLNPVIPNSSNLKWPDVFKSVSIAGDEDIPINKRGSGVKRLVLLNFFRAEVERRYEEGDNTGIIYAIEEPETAQHTENQNKLIGALKELSLSEGVQIIITTHSGNIVKQLQFSNLRMVCDTAEEKEIKLVEPGQLNYPSLNEVNYLAFGDISEEYHDELYSFLDINNLLNSYKTGKQTRLYHKTTRNGVRDEQIILTEYIRHQIHHPENQLNVRYSKDELRTSIEEMRSFISSAEVNSEE